MRIERIGPVFSLALALVAPACGSVLQSPDGGGGNDAGHDSGGVACAGLDEAQCRARTDCAVGLCSAVCGAGTSFVGCYDPRNATPPPCVLLGIACPLLCTSITDEATCTSRSDCRANYCPNCNGGSSFSYCSDAGAAAANICPAIACPSSCSLMTTKETCDARPDCHAVYVDNGACDCTTAGCCARFERCADGPAVCAPPPSLSCRVATPYCEAPAYYVSYSGDCYEGCATAAACAIR